MTKRKITRTKRIEDNLVCWFKPPLPWDGDTARTASQPLFSLAQLN